MWQQADALVGGARAWLIVDDTALPKKGKASVGVAPQYATALGKNANYQTLVSVTLASGEVPVMLSLRLFLPESWTSDAVRLARASVPASLREYRTKPEIAIEEIDRVIAAGVRFGCVLADAGYGLSAPFRQALSARGLCWAVGIPRHQKVYSADVQLRDAAGRVFGMCRTSNLEPHTPCSKKRSGVRSVGARERKGGLQHDALLPCVSASLMARHSG